MYLLLEQPSPTEPLAILCGVFCGFSSLLLILVWATCFARFDLREALLHLAVLCVVSAGINIVLMLLPDVTACFAFVCIAALGVLWPLYLACTSGVPVLNPIEDLSAASSKDIEKYISKSSSSLDIIKQLMTVILAPFAGFLLFALTMGVQKSYYFEVVSTENIGAVLAAALVIPLCFRRSEKPLLPFIYQVYLPVIAAILIVISSLSANIMITDLGLIVLYVFFCIIGLISLGAFCATAHAREFPVALIFGLALASFAACSLIGLGIREMVLITEYFQALLVVSTIYFVVLILTPCLRAWRTAFAPEAPAPVVQELDLEQRCKSLSQKHGLSHRETEVLGYIGRGYSPAYIAKKLFLSDSTVRSHAKNIYRKIGVHSRIELLQLVDDTEDTDT